MTFQVGSGMTRWFGKWTVGASRAWLGLAIGFGAAASLALAQQPPPAEQPAATAAPQAAAGAPAAPEDPVAAKAYAVLDQYCARCHEASKLKVPAPAGQLANILDLAAVAGDRALVRSGNPDGSPLYTLLLTRQMPHTWLAENGGEEPSPDDLQAVRNWIQGLPAQPGAACPADTAIAPQAAEAAISRALEALDEAARKSVRFVSLTHLHNTCRTRPHVAAYAGALAKALNGVSWAKTPARLEPIDEQRTIFKVELDKLDLVSAHWERMATGYPYSSGNTEIAKATGSATPVLRGDWLANALMQPETYGEILGLPARMAELQRLLRVDIEANIRTGKVSRAGVRESRSVSGARIVERHGLITQSNQDLALWLAYDFAGSSGRQNIAEHPLGPSTAPSGRQPFRHDGTRALFHLPNGFMAFAVHDARGDRLARVPDGLNRGPVQPSAGVASCMGCHRAGPVRVKDEVRALAESDRNFPRELRDGVLSLYPSESELDRQFSADVVRYATAMQSVGVNPAQAVAGLEPINALVREYQRGVDAERLAAEAELSKAELARRAEALPEDLRLLALVLRQGVIRRSEANRLLAALSGGTATAPAAAANAETPDLILWSEKERYKVGELVVFGARASADCHLTVVSLDTAGRATVLFPNEFEQSNMLSAGKDLRLPGTGAPYQLRAKDKGRETLVGVCSPTQKLPDGITPDYERQRFTMLGNWSNFLAEARSEEAPERKASDARGAEPKARGKRKAKAKAEGKTEAKRRDIQVRTAITYDIE